MQKQIFISACEPSADLHCVNLITAVKKASYDAQWVGLGGQKMSGAGCELLENTSEKAVMIHNVFGQLGYYRRLIKRVSAYFRSNKVDLVILCDSPAFNFHIAKAAKKAGVPTLFYVAPQLWAWAPWRIGKLRRLCDRLACILPFEEEYFTSRGVAAEFVGNPLFDELSTGLKSGCRDFADFDAQNAAIAIMPGSRDAEIETLWQPAQRIALKLKRKYPNCRFIAVAPTAEKLQVLKDKELEGFTCEYLVDDVPEVAAKCDLAIVASGSATLQVASAACPMVIMYQSHRFLWNVLGRWLVRTKYLSLVNILAQRELVPEFMPCFSSIEPIYDACEGLLEDKTKLARTSGELAKISDELRGKNASVRVAEIVLDMIGLSRL